MILLLKIKEENKDKNELTIKIILSSFGRVCIIL